MSTHPGTAGRTGARMERTRDAAPEARASRRLTTETKSAFKTTELMAYIGLLIAIFVAGAITSGGTDSAGVHHADAFPAHQVWLYATILTIGYIVSRGLAKMGSRDPYDE
jgi:hypothetical protein